MLNTSLALRYARAIYKIAQTLGTTKKVCADLLEISQCIDTNRDLKRVLYHPGITSDEKKRVLDDLFSKKCESTTLKFIGYLIDKKRTFHITAIAQCFSAMLDSDENRVVAKVESMSPLSGETLKKIKERLVKGLEKDIIITSIVNPSLMGGMRLILGDRVIDGSIAYQLKRLSETITAF
jgi:F-type H+-transporting ATPase subunit delta